MAQIIVSDNNRVYNILEMSQNILDKIQFDKPFVVSEYPEILESVKQCFSERYNANFNVDATNDVWSKKCLDGYYLLPDNIVYEKNTIVEKGYMWNKYSDNVKGVFYIGILRND